jgi:two-component system, NarL family, nitrate/nitrite response regulator NarL
MRIVLVGLPDERQRLREQLSPDSVDVVGEFGSVAAANAAAIAADALLVAPGEFDQADRRSLAADEPLTRRELGVLERLVEGLSNKAIAALLGISDQTVKFHVAAICGKLGAANRTDAVRRAIRRGLISV